MKSAINLAAVGAILLSAHQALAFSYPDCVNGPLANNTVCNPNASPADRAAALVKAMNMTEKLAALVNTSPGAPSIGLPAYQWWSEGLHGVALSPGVNFSIPFTAPEFDSAPYSGATSFAAPITLGASFDDDLVYAVASAISTEARAFSNAGRAGLDYWTPNINPYKDPRWGRGAETPGEDAYHLKTYVKHLLSGLEGPFTSSTPRKVIATCKHFAAYDLENWEGVVRHSFNAIVSLQDLSEYYLPSFQQCARDSQVGSIMCSYNAINGTPACANTYLMGDILRSHWGWTQDDNYITSDCGALDDFLPTYHNFSQTGEQAAAIGLVAGTDTVCSTAGGNETWTPYVFQAYSDSLLNETVVDRALERLYHGLVRAGYFDATDPYRSLSWTDVNTPVTQALALRSAQEGIVLLKNDGTLPLTNLAGKTVAMIGFWASASTTNQLLGPYYGIPPYIMDPVTAAQKMGLSFINSTGPIGENASVADTWTADALAAAEQADAIIYFGGNDESLASEAKDRVSIAWPEAQLALIQNISALGKPLVVAQLGDQQDDTPLLSNANVSAILWTGYGGQSAGTAILDAITGVTAPAGRLPVTQYPAAYTDEVPMTDMTLRPATGANPGRTYRWYNESVLPFGYGLHYTTFNVSFGPGGTASSSSGQDLTGVPTSVSACSLLASCVESTQVQHPDLCPFATVPLVVTNTGNVTSDFVALVFAAGEYGPEPYPLKTLVGYQRVLAVKPGETANADVALTLGGLARVDGTGNTVLYPGTYKLMLDVPTRSEVEFEILGAETVLDEFPQPK